MGAYGLVAIPGQNDRNMRVLRYPPLSLYLMALKGKVPKGGKRGKNGNNVKLKEASEAMTSGDAGASIQVPLGTSPFRKPGGWIYIDLDWFKRKKKSKK